MKFVLAKKIGMTTIYGDDNVAQNVTLLEVGKNVVTQIRNEKKDGYTAVQLGRLSDSKSKAKFSKVKEFRVDEKEIADYKVKDKLDVDKFEIGEKVKVSASSKGKGFQGVVKKYGFAGSPASHGHRHDLRAPGSIGCAYPEKVLKGKKMASRMGNERVTVKNLKIVYLDKEKGLLGLKGAVPGNNGMIAEVVGQ
jgi:large subunit ribosomal protein L3